MKKGGEFQKSLKLEQKICYHGLFCGGILLVIRQANINLFGCKTNNFDFSSIFKLSNLTRLQLQLRFFVKVQVHSLVSASRKNWWKFQLCDSKWSEKQSKVYFVKVSLHWIQNLFMKTPWMKLPIASNYLYRFNI